MAERFTLEQIDARLREVMRDHDARMEKAREAFQTMCRNNMFPEDDPNCGAILREYEEAAIAHLDALMCALASLEHK